MEEINTEGQFIENNSEMLEFQYPEFNNIV